MTFKNPTGEPNRQSILFGLHPTDGKGYWCDCGECTRWRALLVGLGGLSEVMTKLETVFSSENSRRHAQIVDLAVALLVVWRSSEARDLRNVADVVAMMRRETAAQAISRSSIGAGLRNIRENGLAAELADLDEDLNGPRRHRERMEASRTAKPGDKDRK